MRNSKKGVIKVPKYKLHRIFKDDNRFPELSDGVQQRILRLLDQINEHDFVASGNKHAVIYGIDLALLQIGYDLQEKEGDENGDKSGEVATAETSTEKSAADARAAKGEG